MAAARIQQSRLLRSAVPLSLPQPTRQREQLHREQGEHGEHRETRGTRNTGTAGSGETRGTGGARGRRGTPETPGTLETRGKEKSSGRQIFIAATYGATKSEVEEKANMLFCSFCQPVH